VLAGRWKWPDFKWSGQASRQDEFSLAPGSVLLAGDGRWRQAARSSARSTVLASSGSQREGGRNEGTEGRRKGEGGRPGEHLRLFCGRGLLWMELDDKTEKIRSGTS
jgi:hypothetical protein